MAVEIIAVDELWGSRRPLEIHIHDDEFAGMDNPISVCLQLRGHTTDHTTRAGAIGSRHIFASNLEERANIERSTELATHIQFAIRDSRPRKREKYSPYVGEAKEAYDRSMAW
jgi:hypothetical protein